MCNDLFTMEIRTVINMDRSIFVERLRMLRREKGISQETLSAALYIDRTTLAGYETGKRMPDIEMMWAIADYFEVTIDYLVGRR